MSHARLVRLIGRLDIKGPNVIKGIHLEGLRVVGNPGELARRYYADGVDELIYMDSVASLYERNSILPIIEEAASDVFVPLTVGGGMRSLDDIKAALRSGADKVAINTAALRRPPFITEASRAFGSQCVVISIEAKSRPEGGWEAYVDNGRERTGRDAIDWAREAEQLCAGEILVTSVDREGTRRGFDHALFQAMQAAVSIPVIGCGGAWEHEHLRQAYADDGLEAIAVASLLHYGHSTVAEMKRSLAGSGVGLRQ
ncbi:MAG: imidazole glycerol phosphate synthase subunit HisF [Rhodospirillaceae bacterium]|nr:imidazole glycerol phosphate synthase subunit HisF [Rhodospirillaceae bacterium]